MKTFQQTHSMYQHFTTTTLTRARDMAKNGFIYNVEWCDKTFCQRVYSILKEMNEPLSATQIYSLLNERYENYITQMSFAKFCYELKCLTYFLWDSKKYKIYLICDKKMNEETFRTWYGLQPIEIKYSYCELEESFFPNENKLSLKQMENFLENL